VEPIVTLACTPGLCAVDICRTNADVVFDMGLEAGSDVRVLGLLKDGDASVEDTSGKAVGEELSADDALIDGLDCRSICEALETGPRDDDDEDARLPIIDGL